VPRRLQGRLRTLALVVPRPRGDLPGPFGSITAGADKNYPLDYSHLNIQGYACGAKGLPKGVKPGPDTATFPSVNTETEYGWTKKVRLKVPIFTGALGSTEIARKNWEHFAIGTAISGITLVCGENVCGIDPKLELDANDKVKNSPEMDRRIETYKRFHQGYGEIRAGVNGPRPPQACVGGEASAQLLPGIKLAARRACATTWSMSRYLYCASLPMKVTDRSGAANRR
jgi:hypothetical protein